MANIKKSFNFRSGVQVDDDNLKVTPTGLVGIGTTVPIEALDVRGNAVISGVTSSVFGKVGFLTVTTLEPTQIVGAGVSIASGIITNPSMDATGIVTYFGDGRFLQGLPTSQWEDTNAGFAVSSIYNTGGTVGIATTNPQFTFQVGNNPNAGEIGVGIASDGHIKITGVVTATTFVGALTGNVTGNVTGNISGNSTGIHNGAVNLGTNESLKVGTAITVTDIGSQVTISKNKNVFHTQKITSGSNLESWGSEVSAGEITVIVPQFRLHRNGPVELYHQNGSKKFSTSGVGVTVFGELDTTNINVSSAATFSSAVDINADLDVDGHTNLDNVSISGVTTSSGNINLLDNVNLQFGDSQDLKIYHGLVGGHSYIENTTGSIRLKNGGSTALEITSDGTTGINNLTVTQGVNVTGVVTATTKLNSALLGIGTDNPAHAIQVRKSSDAEIQITSDAGKASLTLGHEVGTADNDNAEIRFGFSSPGAPYSQDGESLDIINYNGGNFNYHLKNITPAQYGAKATDFHWHRGINNARLMTLTGIGGSLGIGVTIPTKKLHVAGDAFISGESTFGDDATFNQALTVNGTLNATTISADITGTLNGNVNATSGISTFNKVKTTSSNNNFNGIGIKTDNNSNLPFEFYGPSGSLSTRIIISNDGVIGLGTDILHDTIDIVADTKKATFAAVGVGTTTPTAAVDMRYAGQNETGASANRMYMYPPQVTTTQRGNLAGVAAGALIYNTTTNKLQVFNGSAWQDCN